MDTRHGVSNTSSVTSEEIAILPPDQFTQAVWALYREALPDPEDCKLFNRLIREVSGQHLTYVQALMCVAERRSISGDDSEHEANHITV